MKIHFTVIIQYVMQKTTLATTTDRATDTDFCKIKYLMEYFPN